MTRLSLGLSRQLLYLMIALLGAMVLSVPACAQFETRTMFGISGESFAVAVGDFNRDGKLDVAVPTGSSLTIYLGNGDGTFKKGASYPVPRLYYIAAADFNNDGMLDLAVSGVTDLYCVEVFLGNGDGTFQSPKVSPTTELVSSLSVGDFNGDHKMDLALADGDYVSVLLGNGDGTFQAPIDNGSFPGPHQVAVADFRNDDKLDVAVVGYFGGAQDLGILLGNGDGTLQSAAIYPLIYLPCGVATGDLRNNGLLDVIVGECSAGIMVFLGNGDGTFGSASEYSGGGGLIVVGDFNRGGKLDVIGTPSLPGVAEYLGNGDGTFQAATVSLTGSGGLAAAGDLNGDGLPDAVLLYTNHDRITTMLNSGVLTFSPSTPLSFPAQLINTSSNPKTVTLTNTATSAVSISSVRASGPLQITDTCGSEIAAGDSCTVSATFAPLKSGQQSGGITLIDSASSKPQFIELEGAGTPIQLSPPSLNFGSQKVGSKSAPKVVTVTNEGTTSVTDKSVTIGGADSGDFSETDDCAGQSLPPGGSCKVSVIFAPKKTGKRTAALYVNMQGTVGPQPASLIGTGD